MLARTDLGELTTCMPLLHHMASLSFLHVLYMHVRIRVTYNPINTRLNNNNNNPI